MNNQKGVFSQNDLRRLIYEGNRLIPNEGFDEAHIGSASVDLTGTREAYRVKNLLQPSQLKNERIFYDLLPLMDASPIVFGEEMHVGETIITKATLGVNFSPGMYGYFSAKSSSGRNFIFARSLADGITTFDSVDRRDRGYTGEVWIVLQPLVFPVLFTNKERYNQFRAFDGDTRFKQPDLEALLRNHDLLYRRETQEPYKQGELSLFTHDGSILSTLYAPPDKLIGFRSKKNTKAIDLTRRDLDPREYFEPVHAEVKKIDGRSVSFVTIEAGYYYLLSTNEMIKVPETHTAELVALDPRLGFFFTHFAGFFDNGFFGTATLEIYAPFTVQLRDKQPAKWVKKNPSRGSSATNSAVCVSGTLIISLVESR
jgi:deoxycytidine triphosphate deaminase